MFKKIITFIVDYFNKINNVLQRTYNETYSDIELSKKLQEEIEKRKENNKQGFIDNMILAIGVSSMMRCTTPPTIEEAKERAETMFEEALQRGNLDELYNLKDQKDWR